MKENKSNSINLNDNISIEQILVNSFNKLIEFLDELKYDYIQTKQENLNIMKEKAIDAMKILKNETEQNMNENEIEEYKQKIDQLLNDNKILKDQIEINNRKNQMKEINDNNNALKCEDLEKQIADLKEKNDDLQLKLNNMNDGNLDMDNKYNILENENDKFKNYENMLKELKEKYDNLTFDYQRIQKENNSLKSIINNQ